jgi:hypothetical protein
MKEAFPLLFSKIADLVEKQGGLEERIAKLQGSTPGAGDGATAATAATGATGTKFETATAAIKAGLSGILPP